MLGPGEEVAGGDGIVKVLFGFSKIALTSPL